MPKKRKLSEVLKGTPDYEHPTTTLSKIRDSQRYNERAILKHVRPVRGATYEERNRSDPRGNADYVGPMIGAGSGTRDKMPGTTPSQSDQLPRTSTKRLSPPSDKKKRKPGTVV